MLRALRQLRTTHICVRVRVRDPLPRDTHARTIRAACEPPVRHMQAALQPPCARPAHRVAPSVRASCAPHARCTHAACVYANARNMQYATCSVQHGTWNPSRNIHQHKPTRTQHVRITHPMRMHPAQAIRTRCACIRGTQYACVRVHARALGPVRAYAQPMRLNTPAVRIHRNATSCTSRHITSIAHTLHKHDACCMVDDA